MNIIERGQIAPTFKAETFRGEPIDLAAYRGKKVWLGFYRWAACPLCNLRVSEIVEAHHEFEKAGIQLIAVLQSPAENIARYVAKQDPPFPLIPDPGLELYTTYGVHPKFMGLFHPSVLVRTFKAVMKGFFSLRGDGPKAMIPADFLLDPEGLVYQSYYGNSVVDHIPFDDVRKFGADLCLDMPEAS